MGVAGKGLIIWLILNVVIVSLVGALNSDLTEPGAINDTVDDNATSLTKGDINQFSAYQAKNEIASLPIPIWLIAMLLFLDTATGIILIWQTFIGG